MSPLRVAILHYHLRGGGVTNVIKYMHASLAHDEYHLGVITGEEAPEDFPLPHACIPGLSYGDSLATIGVKQAKKSILSQATELLGGEVDVLHVHNYSLGKNPIYTEAILQLAEEGLPIVMHLHDFCEDYRPSNFKLLQAFKRKNGTVLTEQLYPIGHNVHYAVLNARDYNYLKLVGIPNSQLHLLPNPVIAPSIQGGEKQPHPFKYIIYPVRAIPRKNMAELLFWAAHPEEHLRFGVTLAPKNPQYLSGYKALLEFSTHQQIPVDFEAGKQWKKSFEEVIGGASAIISTSIAEGFGLAYLESWLSGKALVGRKLPEIMSAFEEDGIDFSGMYHELMVPIELLDEEKVKAHLYTYALESYQAYGINNAMDKASEMCETLLKNGRIDFGRLSQSIQLELLQSLKNEPSLFSKIANEPLSRHIPPKQQIEHNQQIIKQKYSPDAFAERLGKIYQTLIHSNSEAFMNYVQSDSLIPHFLNSEGISLLR